MYPNKHTQTPSVPSFTRGYRFGFNGQEKDDEIAGSGNSYTAMFWQYDSRLGRRWNIDPVDKPWESSYLTFGGNPIYYVDINGDNMDGYTMDDDGNVDRVDDTGGDDYDVLYTKKDYEAAKAETKETGEKNEYGNPEPGNSVRVSKGTFSESNKISLGGVNGIKVSNEADAKAIYKFAADNFSVEYGIVTGDNNGYMSIVHTSGGPDYSETGEVAKYMIDNGFFLTETNHSHPGGVEYEKPSGFYTNGQPISPLTGDAKSAKWIDEKNGASVKHYMYHPKSGKTHQYNHLRNVETR